MLKFVKIDVVKRRNNNSMIEKYIRKFRPKLFEINLEGNMTDNMPNSLARQGY